MEETSSSLVSHQLSTWFKHGVFKSEHDRHAVELELRRQVTLRRDTSEWLVANSLGLDVSQAQLPRYIPTELFVAIAKNQMKEAVKLVKAFDGLLEAAGFGPFDDSLPEFGSMRLKRIRRTKYRKTAKQLDERTSLLQLVLTKSFMREGLQVDAQPEDRAAMERVEASHKAELKKIEAETEQAKAEAGKAKAEGLKALMEASDKFVKILRSLGVTFALTIGALNMWGTAHPADQKPEKPTIEFKINSHKLGPNETKEWSGNIWVRLPEKHGIEAAKAEEDHDPLDPE